MRARRNGDSIVTGSGAILDASYAFEPSAHAPSETRDDVSVAIEQRPPLTRNPNEPRPPIQRFVREYRSAKVLNVVEPPYHVDGKRTARDPKESGSRTASIVHEGGTCGCPGLLNDTSSALVPSLGHSAQPGPHIVASKCSVREAHQWRHQLTARRFRLQKTSGSWRNANSTRWRRSSA